MDNIITQVENTPDDWVWSYHGAPSDLRKNRILSLQPSPHLDFVIAALTKLGHHCEIQPVAYELQRNGNKMLKITANLP